MNSNDNLRRKPSYIGKYFVFNQFFAVQNFECESDDCLSDWISGLCDR